MTSAILTDYVQTHHVLQALKLEVLPEEIYRAANFAQAEILRETELLEEYVSPTFIAAQEVYTISDSGWAFLARTVRVKFGQNIDSPFVQVKQATKEWADHQRYLVQKGYTKPSPPQYVYHRLTNPLSVGFWGEPTSATGVNLTIVRGHSDADNITDSTNPLIPQGYDEIMTVGTVLKLIEFRSMGEKDNKGEFTKALLRLKPEFTAMKLQTKISRTTVHARTIGLKGVRA